MILKKSYISIQILLRSYKNVRISTTDFIEKMLVEFATLMEKSCSIDYKLYVGGESSLKKVKYGVLVMRLLSHFWPAAQISSIDTDNSSRPPHVFLKDELCKKVYDTKDNLFLSIDRRVKEGFAELLWRFIHDGHWMTLKSRSTVPGVCLHYSCSERVLREFWWWGRKFEGSCESF